MPFFILANITHDFSGFLSVFLVDPQISSPDFSGGTRIDSDTFVVGPTINHPLAICLR